MHRIQWIKRVARNRKWTVSHKDEDRKQKPIGGLLRVIQCITWHSWTGQLVHTIHHGTERAFQLLESQLLQNIIISK